MKKIRAVCFQRVKMNKNLTPFVGESDFANRTRDLIENLSKDNASVLLIGERGTGKRLISQHIHYAAAKNFGYFFEINCKSFEKRQILQAFSTVENLIDLNQKVTLFLCFVDELSDELQRLFLNFFCKIANKRLNVKIICSVENSLEEKVANGSFISDLYYRLNSVVLNILPLRQRKEDILPIAQNYVKIFSKKSGYKFEDFSQEAKKIMLNKLWRGNADELINAVQRAFIVGKPPVIKSADLGIENFNCFSEDISGNEDDKTLKKSVETFKKAYIAKILEENGWNQTKAAKTLGIQRTYVIKLINELDIRKDK